MNFRTTNLVYKAYGYIEKGEFSKAVELLESAAAKFPEDEEIQAYLGEAYILDQQYDKALAAFARRDELLLQSHPLTPYIEGYRGRVYLEKGEISRAKELLQKKSVEDAREPEVLYSLGLLHLLDKNWQEARKVLRKIDSCDPSFYFRKIQSLLKQLPDDAQRENS